MMINAADTAALTRMLSAERLQALMALTGSSEAAIELHQETLRLGAALLNVTATIEIALRNSICENLSQHFVVPNWLVQPPVWFQWRDPEQQNIAKALDSAQRAEYAKLTQAQKGALDALAYPKGRPPNTPHLKRAKDRRKQLAVTDGKIIAEITLYLWKHLYSAEYEQTLWRPTLKRTFPNKALTRAAVAINLEQIYQSRNRLAHHEPVLYTRFDNTLQAITFVVENLETTTPSSATPLARLVAEDMADVKARAAALHGRLNAFRAAPSVS